MVSAYSSIILGLKEALGSAQVLTGQRLALTIGAHSSPARINAVLLFGITFKQLQRIELVVTLLIV